MLIFPYVPVKSRLGYAQGLANVFQRLAVGQNLRRGQRSPTWHDKPVFYVVALNSKSLQLAITAERSGQLEINKIIPILSTTAITRSW